MQIIFLWCKMENNKYLSKHENWLVKIVLVYFSSFDAQQSQLHQSLIKYAKSHLQRRVASDQTVDSSISTSHRACFTSTKIGPAEEAVKSFWMRRTPVGRDKVSRRYSLSRTSPAPKLTRKTRFIIYARGTPRPPALRTDSSQGCCSEKKRGSGGCFLKWRRPTTPFKNLLLVEWPATWEALEKSFFTQ